MTTPFPPFFFFHLVCLFRLNEVQLATAKVFATAPTDFSTRGTSTTLDAKDREARRKSARGGGVVLVGAVSWRLGVLSVSRSQGLYSLPNSAIPCLAQPHLQFAGSVFSGRRRSSVAKSSATSVIVGADGSLTAAPPQASLNS